MYSRAKKGKFMRRVKVHLAVFALFLVVQLIPTAGASPGLPAPSLISPPNNVLENGRSQTFRWAIVSGADNYEFQCSTDNSFPSNLVVSIPNIRDNSAGVELADGAHYWRVRAGRDNGEVGSWSTMWKLTIDTIPPQKPELVSPQSGVYLENSTVRLDWTDAAEAENYTVLVDDNENLGSPVVNVIVAASVYTTPTLPDGKYYWKVVARDLAGNENQSSVGSFTVDVHPPMAPSLLTPPNGAYINDNTPTLSWENAFDTVGIARLEVWVDGLLESRITDNTLKSTTTHALADGSHSWYVIVVDYMGHENRSPTWSFIIDTVLPSMPCKSGPQNGTVTPVTAMTFSWSAATDNLSGLACYELWVDDDPNFGSPAFLDNLTSTLKAMSLLDDNYSWRVRAWDRAGNASTFENVWTLLIDTTAPPKPSPIWPAWKVVENKSTPQFRWARADDPSGVTYEIQVATENNFWSWNVVYSKAGIVEDKHDIENVLPDRYSDNLEAGPFYYWRVRARDNLGHIGEWSDNLPFMVFLRDFALSLAPSSSKVVQGGSTLSIVTTAKIGGYENAVDLYVSGAPSGVDIYFDRMGPPPITSSMIINTGETAPPGVYTLTVTGRGRTGQEHTVAYTLEILKKPTATILEIPAGEQRAVEINKANIAEMTVGARNRVENVAINVEGLESQPAGIPAVGGLVYSYANIEASVSSSDIESLKIKFWVERSWIQLNNIDVSKIRLNRYSASGWEQLTTSKVEEGFTKIYFLAESPGFSTFAITGEELISPSILSDWRFLAGIAVVVIALVGLVAWRRRGPKEKFEVAGAEAAPEKPRKAKGEEW